MTSFINDKFRGMHFAPSFNFSGVSESPVEIVPAGRRCLLTALSVTLVGGAGEAVFFIEDKAGGDMWSIGAAAGATVHASLSFPHPIFSDNGMQTNPTGTPASVVISVGYIDLDSGII